jgi:hypothetical protein
MRKRGRREIEKWEIDRYRKERAKQIERWKKR